MAHVFTSTSHCLLDILGASYVPAPGYFVYRDQCDVPKGEHCWGHHFNSRFELVGIIAGGLPDLERVISQKTKYAEPKKPCRHGITEKDSKGVEALVEYSDESGGDGAIPQRSTDYAQCGTVVSDIDVATRTEYETESIKARSSDVDLFYVDDIMVEGGR